MVCTNGFFLYIFGGIYRASPMEKGTGQYCLNYSETQERGALGELKSKTFPKTFRSVSLVHNFSLHESKGNNHIAFVLR